MPAEPLCLFTGQMALPALPEVEAALETPWRFATWVPDESEEKLAALLGEADALMTGADSLSGRLYKAVPAARRLKLWQIPFSGYDWLDRRILPSGTVVCNVWGHQPAIAEWVMAAILAVETGLLRFDAEFRAGSWQSAGLRQPSVYHREVAGKRLGIVGYGQIGREVAERAAALGMSVAATARRARPAEPPLAWLGSLEDLPRLLSESDYVALTCDLNDTTRGLIDASALARMKPEAVLVNVARGEVIEEAALYEALRTRRIAGAALDVWWVYPDLRKPEDPGPRPAHFPFHELPNVILSPHRSGITREGEARRWRMIAGNLDRLSRGEALRNVVIGADRPTP